MVRVGIVGAGTVGQSMARALLAVGHDVVLSSREPDGPRMRALLAELGSAASAAAVADTVATTDVVFLSVPASAVQDVASAPAPWDGKVLIDATNRMSGGGSPSQELQAGTDARVVKCFNTIGAEHYQDPVFQGHPASMPLCGDDAEARGVVASLASQLGFEPVDLGGLEHAPLLDALARMWIMRMLATGNRAFALTLLPK